MFRKMKKRMNRIAQNEKGSASMYFIIFMVFFLPFAIWIGVTLPLKFEATYEVKQMVSNTADSMISRLDQPSLAKGVASVDISEADLVARRMIETTLNTDSEGKPSGEGILKESVPIHSPLTLANLTLNEETGVYYLPEEIGVYVYVINNPTEVINVNGLLPIDETTVIVHANVPVTSFGTAIIHKTGVSEAHIYVGEET